MSFGEASYDPSHGAHSICYRCSTMVNALKSWRALHMPAHGFATTPFPSQASPSCETTSDGCSHCILRVYRTTATVTASACEENMETNKECGQSVSLKHPLLRVHQQRKCNRVRRTQGGPRCTRRAIVPSRLLSVTDSTTSSISDKKRVASTPMSSSPLASGRSRHAAVPSLSALPTTPQFDRDGTPP